TLVGFILSILSIIPTVTSKVLRDTYIIFQILLLSTYTTEYVLRCWACSVNEKYRRFRRLYYMVSPYMLIGKHCNSNQDLAVICTSVPIIVFIFWQHDTTSEYEATIFLTNSFLLFLRFVQILRFFRFERFHGSVRLMTTVLYELFTGYCSALMLILFTSFIIYLIEKDAEDNIQSMSDSFYFTVISFLTIGYGDIVPTSFASRFVIISMAFLGVALVAVPSGIIGSGFAIQVASRNKKRHQREVLKPALILLQRAARAHMYMSDNSCTEERDCQRALSSPKKIFFSRIQKEQAGTPPPSHQLTFTQGTADFNLKINQYEQANTISYSKPTNASRIPLQQIFHRFKILKRIFVLNYQKNLNIKYPVNVDELLENLENTQKKMTYYMEEIHTGIKALRQKNKSHASMPMSDTCHNCDRLSTQISDVKSKIETVEKNVHFLVSLLDK
ncbi:hypothetical protein MXB_5440, partial [Myxobolus squamalis]